MEPCQYHEQLADNVEAIKKDVAELHETNKSVLGNLTNLYMATEELKAGMLVEVGNGKKIQMPVGQLIGKLYDNETIRNSTFGRQSKLSKFWEKWGIAIIVPTSVAVLGFFGNKIIQGQEEIKANQLKFQYYIEKDTAYGQENRRLILESKERVDRVLTEFQIHINRAIK